MMTSLASMTFRNSRMKALVDESRLNGSARWVLEDASGLGSMWTSSLAFDLKNAVGWGACRFSLGTPGSFRSRSQLWNHVRADSGLLVRRLREPDFRPHWPDLVVS